MAHNDVVVMPTFARPEFLALSLGQIDKAIDAPDDIRIYLDTSSDERLNEVEWVRDVYLPRAEIFHAKAHVYAPSGCWNILHAIKSGYETGARRVFLIEEDVCIRSQFFSWHRSQDNYLASCGRKDPNFYKLYPDIYCNPGSCLRRELIEQLIPHICDDYFTRLRDYLDEKFGPWPEMSNLDDGLIRRIIREMQGKVIYPDKPTCSHQGWGLYNKIDIYKNYETDIEKKIIRLCELISMIRPGDRYAKDFEF